MSATGLEVFDRTLQETNIWLKEIMDEIGPDRQRAYHALRAVLHALRDRLTVDEAAHLSAQLPMMVRGIFFEGWHPAGKPTTERTRDEFLARVGEGLRGIEPINAEAATRAVFRTIEKHVSPGEVQDVVEMLPKPLRSLWP
jgi:uncharacterized protein (DUF2267 family)